MLKFIRNWPQTFFRGLLYCLVIFVPAFFSTDFASVFAAPKMIVLRVLVLVGLLMWGSQIFLKNKIRYRKGPFNIFLMAYGAFLAISTLTSVTPWTSLWGMQGHFLGLITFLHFGCLLWLLFQNSLEETKKEPFVFFYRLLLISCITSIILAFYGLLQYFSLSPDTSIPLDWGQSLLGWFAKWQESFSWDQNPAERVFGTIGHATHFGVYLAMHCMISFYLAPSVKNVWGRWVLRIGAILQFIVLILTAARGPLLAVILVSFGFVLKNIVIRVKNRSFDNTINKTKFTFWRIVATSILLLSVTEIVVSQNWLQKIPLIERSGNSISAFMQGRIPDRVSWWLSSLEMFKDRPIAGFGLATFRDVYNNYRRTDYKTLEDGGMEDRITPEAAHNEYFNLLATEGVAGFSLFMILIGGALRSTTSGKRKNIVKNDRKRNINLALQSGILVYSLHLFFSFFNVATFTIFIVLIGIAYAMPKPAIYRAMPLLPWQRLIASGTLLCLVTGGLYVTFREAKAEIFFREAQRIAAQSNLEQTIEMFSRTIAEKPTEYIYYQAFGDSLMQFVMQSQNRTDIPLEQLINMAIINYEKAINVNDWHPSTYYNLGLAEAQLYQLQPLEIYYQRAYKNFETSIQKAVNNPLYPYQVGKALLGLYQVITSNTFGTVNTNGVNAREIKKQAVGAFEKALKIRAGYADAEKILQNL